MGWLERLDKRNQAVADYLLEHPEAGTQVDPYAKSPQARRRLAAVCAAVFVAWLLLGWIAGIVVLVAAAPLMWFQEHHPWLHGRAEDSEEDRR